MKTKYEYYVVNEEKEIFAQADTREQARSQKRYWEEYGTKLSIIQRKYVLAEQRKVR